MAQTAAANIEETRRAFEDAGQGHVFSHWDALDAGGRDALARQAGSLVPRLAALKTAFDVASAPAAEGPGVQLEPPKVTELPEHGGDAERLARARLLGADLLAEGRVGLFVVAGGQGTRLGFAGPKGAFRVGPVSKRTLFELQAQKIRALRRRSGRALPWYIMTSPSTDAATREQFDNHDCFGLPARDIFFLEQETMPAFDDSGRFIMKAPDCISESPGGHGGALPALADSGALADMATRGIDRLFYYQVDNPLAEIGDPALLGLHELDEAEMSCKVVRKENPMEKVGVVARTGDAVGIVEYSELGDRERDLRDEQGRLVYWAGSIAIHVFNTGFIRRIAESANSLLPYHAAHKKVPTIDGAGQPLSPEVSNGVKLERFVFDALPQARRVCIQEVRADEEFAPIKNAEGPDSPGSARKALVDRYQAWIKGTPLEDELRGCIVEIDQSIIDGANEMSEMTLRGCDEARKAIQIATGTIE